MTILLAALLFTFLVFSRCQNVDKIRNTQVFRYNEDQSVNSLDPAYVKNQSEIWIASQIFNGLIELDSVLKPSPSLALRWEVLEGGLVYKFHLRSGIRFYGQDSALLHKPRWVTAHDAVYSFGRLIDPKTASPGAWIFSDKVLMPAGFDSLSLLPAGKRPFYAPNDSTLIIRLRRPFSAFLSLLGTSYCYILPREIVERDPVAFGRQPSGTGPFYTKIWETDVKIVLRRNPHYFEKENGQSLPYLEAVNVDLIKNKQTAFMRFIAGEYDFFNGLESSFKDELLSREGRLRSNYEGAFHMLQTPFLNTEYLGFYLGVKTGPQAFMNNRHLRRALAMAINRENLVKYVRNGVGVPGTAGFVPPVFVQGRVKGLDYNPAAALKELELAGFPRGKGLPVLQVTTTNDYLDLIVLMKKDWAEVGIRVDIDVQASGMLRQMRNKGSLQMFRGSWIADYTDPENYLACFYSGNFSPSGPNYTHYSEAGFDAMYERLSMTDSETEKNALVLKADEQVVQDAAVIVLYYDKSIRLFHNNVVGFSNDASNRLNLKRVRKQ